MFRSVREKYDYNKRRGGLFSSGYCFGVTLYNDYAKSDKPLKSPLVSLLTVSMRMRARARSFQRA